MSAPIAAENLAQAIRQVARRARSEEDLRVGVEHALGATLQALGLTATPEYEKTTLSGSADAIYGHVVIEYKRPGHLAEKGFPARPAEQIARYLTDLAVRRGSPQAHRDHPRAATSFAVHTYYALLMKFLAVELASLQSGALVGSFVAPLPAMTETVQSASNSHYDVIGERIRGFSRIGNVKKHRLKPRIR